MKRTLLLLIFFICICTARAQNVGVGTTTPHSSAKLDVTSTNSGFLPPRMTYAQRNAIPSPAQGLMIYCIDCGTDGGEPQFFNGTTWKNMLAGTASLPPATPVANKISILNAAGTEVAIVNTIAEIKSYIDTHPINEAVTIRFNTSETFLLSTVWNINYANNGFLLTIKAASGQTPVIDGQSLNVSVAQVAMNNVWIEGLTFQNADPNNNAGCLVRADGTSNTTFKNITYIRGYCAMRATANVYNLTIDGAVVKQTTQGSFRLGNGTSAGINGLWDMQNVNISNVVLVDDLNGGNIPGTSGPFLGLMLLKKCNGLTVKNMTIQGTGGVASSFVEIESSSNVDLQNIIATNFGRSITGQSLPGRGIYCFGCSAVSVKNCFARGFDDTNSKIGLYMSDCSDISVQSSTFVSANANNISGQLYHVKKVNSINGCIFVGLVNNPALSITFVTSGYTASVETDFLEEKNNVFIAADSYYTMLQVAGASNNGGATIKVQNQGGGIISPATWQATYTRGQNSQYSFNPSSLVFMADGKHLAPNSLGRNLVASQIGSATTDAAGLNRSFPTDCGAYDSDAN